MPELFISNYHVNRKKCRKPEPHVDYIDWNIKSKNMCHGLTEV